MKKQSTYTACFNLWFEFYKSRMNGNKPFVTPITGTYLKQIIKAFKTNYPDTTPEQCLSAIFNNWHLLPTYYQKQIEPKQIYINLSQIVNEIKLAVKKRTDRIPDHWK